MYSWEITQTLEHYGYNLPSHVYLDITKNSPQIKRVTYSPWNNHFEIRDNEGCYWEFNVYYEAA